MDGKVLEGLTEERLRNVPGKQLSWDRTLLGRPSDLRDVGRRILTFWQSFYYEKLLSIITGLPSAYEDSEEARITTVWPSRFAEYESVSSLVLRPMDPVN